MFIRLRENIQRRFLFNLLILFIFLLLFLSVGHDFLHNHEPDLKYHHDCPAHQIFLIFSSAIVFNFILCIFLLVWLYHSIIKLYSICTFNYCIYESRAPPFLYFLKIKQH